ncbi:MAG: lipoyl synthase, partial [Actinobacteria bacterium]|nr:lipoyl synthase [Actinomycetota bacterium]
AGPQVYNHNVETVPRLYPTVRPKARFRQSLELLRYVRQLAPGITTKSGFMLGLGESAAEVEDLLAVLHAAAVDIVTIGQYLRPSMKHLPVERWVEPAEFEAWAAFGHSLGVPHVFAGPLVRSSYHAAEAAARAGAGS